MTEKLIGRIEASQECSSNAQFAQQAWTPQAMRGFNKTTDQLPHQFGNFQLCDNSERQLQGNATINTESTQSPYGTENQNHPQRRPQHHDTLNGNASKHGNASQHHDGSQKTDYLVGDTQIPASYSGNSLIPSETLHAQFKASDYHEGQHFNSVLPVPAEKGKHHYYNGLANAHYENGHLKGVPCHIENGKMTSHLVNEVDIPLHHRN
jgi:hypothetical protein